MLVLFREMLLYISRTRYKYKTQPRAQLWAKRRAGLGLVNKFRPLSFESCNLIDFMLTSISVFGVATHPRACYMDSCKNHITPSALVSSPGACRYHDVYIYIYIIQLTRNKD